MSIPEDGIPGWDRAALTRGIHACDSHALIAFYSHFRPLLSERAIFFGISPTDCGDAVETFLGDMLLALASGEELPQHLHGYVLISFRRFAAKRGVAAEKEKRALDEYRADSADSGRRVAEAEVSYQLSPSPHHARSGNALPDASAVNPALTTFCEMLLAELDAEDRFMLGAKAEEMPLREIAGLLGVNYNAANTRLFRVRARLREKAPAVVARMDSAERGVVEAFLRRARKESPTQSSARGVYDAEARERRSSNG